MRLLHVIAAMDPKQGGVSQAVRSMIKGLSQFEVESEVVSSDDPNEKFLSVNTFPIHALGPGKGSWHFCARLIPWLLNNLALFDAVIIHGLWLYTGFAVKKALRLSAKKIEVSKTNFNLPKVFVMPHGMLDPYFQQAPGRHLKALRNTLYWKLIEGSIVNNADKILFTSEEESTLAKETFSPYKPKAEAVVGLGVEQPPVFTSALKEAFSQKCPTIGDLPYLLFLSRIHEKKGIDLLVNAFAILLKNKGDAILEIPNRRLPKLVIAGPGVETEYGKKIKSLVSANSFLSQSVVFAGMLTGKAKWGAFYGCDAFVLPSHQENFGIAVVEAMACQKPVLISDKINIWQDIKETGSGIISSATLEGVSGLLESWFELSSEKKIVMGKNAQALFQKAFSIKAASKQLAAALK